MLRFQKLEDEEQTKDQRSLKAKKDMIKQEFEHLEEIKKYENMSIDTSNDFKFKAELDKLQAMNRQKQLTLKNLQKPVEQESKLATTYSQMQTQSQFGAIRSINNHHSDPLFQTMSKNLLVHSTGEMEIFKEELKEQEARYDNLILEEQERSEQLKGQLQEIEKSKLILQQKVQELQLLQKIAVKRFANTETLFFLANEKNAMSKHNLKSIKGELSQMQQIRGQYKEIQYEKEKDLQKVIYVGEENIGHNIIKIEEAQATNTQLLLEIEKLERQEKVILKKREKSRYILKYIECFEAFEMIFMNLVKTPQARLIDQYTVNEELLTNSQILDTQINTQADLDRNELVQQINRFCSKEDNRTQKIMEFMLEKYWHMQQELGQASLQYETLLQNKNQLLEDIAEIDLQMLQLLQNNPNLEVHQQSSIAEDAGLLIVSSETTTLNIKKMEVEEQTDKVLAAKATKAQGLLMKFQLSLAEFIQRAYQTIASIEDKNRDIKKFKYQALDKEFSEFENFVATMYHKKNLIPVTPSAHDQQEQHISLYQITEIFNEVLGQKVSKKAIQYFYVQCKTDQILWFHLTPENIRRFLQSNTNFETSDSINQFRETLIQIFKTNFQQLLGYYKMIYEKLRNHITDLNVHLKENNPKFDPSKLQKVIPREGETIKNAKELALKRMQEYKTGDQQLFKKEQSTFQKMMKPKTEDEATNNIIYQGIVKVMQPEIHAQAEAFLLETKEYNEENLNQIRSFFRGKLHQKQEPVLFKKQQIKSDHKKQTKKDDLSQERDSLKAQIASDLQKLAEEKERKEKPELKEQQNERKTQIKQSTERLYGERGSSVQMLRNFTVTTNILSDIDRLEQQPSKIEQPQLVSSYIMQRKNMNRNLNKDLTLPTLSYLKPTSAYYSRRNQSSEQIKALDYKRYYEIEHGVSSRPQTQNIQRKQIQKNFNTDHYKQKYGQITKTLQDKLPQPIVEYNSEGPKSILVAQI